MIKNAGNVFVQLDTFSFYLQFIIVFCLKVLNNTEITSKQKHCLQGNFYLSMQMCHYHDMEMLSIETAQENDFIYQRLNHLRKLL